MRRTFVPKSFGATVKTCSLFRSCTTNSIPVAGAGLENTPIAPGTY